MWNGDDVVNQTCGPKDLGSGKTCGSPRNIFLWLMSGPLNLRITVCNFRIPETCLSSTGVRLLRAFPSAVRRGNLDRKNSPLSDETELPDPINEASSDPMYFIMKKLGAKKKASGGEILEFVAISEA